MEKVLSGVLTFHCTIKISKKGIILTIGFWQGVAGISLINILLIGIRRDQFEHDWYIVGVSVIVLIVFAFLFQSEGE